jgi:tetratricopeptide (TPR) repeat protein
LGVEVWAWFGVEANQNTLGAIISALVFLGGIAAAILSGARLVYRKLTGRPDSEEKDNSGPTGNQPGSGNQFVANTIGNVTITEVSPDEVAPPEPVLKMTLEQFEARQQQAKDEIRAELEVAHGEDRTRLEGELAEVQRRLADLPAAFDEAQKTIADLNARLERMGNEIGGDRLAEARESMARLDFSVADEIFAEVEAKNDLNVKEAARAAFGRGEVAEEEVRWGDAADHYVRAARLDPSYETLGKAGSMLWRAGRHGEAIRHDENLVKLAETDYGEASEQTATALNNLAVDYREIGRFEQAETLFRQALEIGRKTLGEDHPDYATRLNNLAGLLQATGHFEEAETLFGQALEIGRKTLGEDHPDYATRLNNLAGLLETTGRYEEAEPLCRQALEITRKTLGKDHPAYAIRLSSLAALLGATGRVEEAEPLFRQALEVTRKTLSEVHPDFATRLNNLAGLLKETGRFDESEPLIRQALEITGKTLGEDHPDYAVRLNNLAALLQGTGRTEEAEPLCRRALEITRKSLGETHPAYANRLNNFAGLLRATGRSEEAEPLARKALEISEAALGPDHPRTKLVRKNLDTLLADRPD